MAEFITQQEAVTQLRLDADGAGNPNPPDARWLTLWIRIVSQSILGWLKDDWRAYVVEVDAQGLLVLDSNEDPIVILDSNGEPIVRDQVIGACLLELASQYKYREGEGDNVVPSDAGYGYVLSKGATALLAPLRRSTVA